MKQYNTLQDVPRAVLASAVHLYVSPQGVTVKEASDPVDWEPSFVIPVAEVPVGVVLSDKAYRDLFTQAEQDALLSAAASGDTGAQRILLQLQTASTGVDLSSPRVAAGLSYMVAKGWLTEGRKVEVLGYTP